MHDEFERFIAHPTGRSYRAARAALLAELGSIAPKPLNLSDLGKLTRLCEAGRWRQANRQLDDMLPGWALSPRFHYLAAWVADCLEDPETADLERWQMQCCLQGILATGRGTRRSPLLITYLSDQRDVLMARQQDAERQMVVGVGEQVWDVIVCQDGTEVWFDISRLVTTTVCTSALLATIAGSDARRI